MKTLCGHTPRPESGGSWTREEGSCVCTRGCSLEGRGRERGAQTGERPSPEKDAIVKGDSCTRGPRRENPSPFFSVCAEGPRRKEEGAEMVGVGRREKGEKRGV